MTEAERLQAAARLKAAREMAGYRTAAEGWQALVNTGVEISKPTYYGHENGSYGYSRVVGDYARAFRVSADWLISARGPMKPGQARIYAPKPIPMMGKVGAGGRVGPIDPESGDEPFDHLDWPDPAYIGALEVDGDSQEPRYIHGEIILYDRRPRAPGDLVNRYAIVDLLDGRRMVKFIRHATDKSSRGDLWRLESLNAPAIDNERLLAAYEIWPRARR